jgi:hypothetical protein
MKILQDAETYAAVLKLKNNAVSYGITQIFVFQTHHHHHHHPRFKKYVTKLSWAQLKNRPLIVESVGLTSELNEGFLPASKPGLFAHKNTLLYQLENCTLVI